MDAQRCLIALCVLLLTVVVVLSKEQQTYSECYNNHPKDCTDIDIKQGSGLYKIYPTGSDGFNVYCEMDIDNVNGGWTVFQKRLNGDEYFFRNWKEYKAGFGNLHKEFWLGNDKLHILTSQGDYELMIAMWDFANENRYATYTKFRIGSEKEKYKLSFVNYTGNAGDGLNTQKDQGFSTKDRDNDHHQQNCAESFKGAWWYNHCHESNLNGLYLSGNHSSYADGINWLWWKGHHYSLKTTIMMLRRT